MHTSRCVSSVDRAHQCIHLDRVGPNGGERMTPAMHEAISKKSIAMTLIPKLDHAPTGNGSEPYATPLARIPRVDEDECVGCNLCALVCPVESCITMEQVETGLAAQSWAQRMGDASNPARKCD